MTTFRAKYLVINDFKALCNAHPDKTVYWAEGTSSKGRKIWCFAIGNPNAPKVLFDGSLHGWEDYGTEVFLVYARWLLESGNTTAQWILNNVQTLLVPVLNMDNPNSGDPENSANTTLSDHRQNGNNSQCQYGVDLNRNFVYGWSSTACGSYPNTYHGTSAGSEAEAKVIRGLLNRFRPAIYLNTHIGGNYVQGRGDSTKIAQIKARYQEIATSMGQGYYPVSSSGGGNGMAYGDAQEFGAIGFMNEMVLDSGNGPIPADNTGGSNYGHTKYLLSTIQTKLFNYALPLYIAFSEYAASTVAPPPVTTYNLVIASASGGTTSPAAGTYVKNEGDSVTLTANPNTNNTFVSWNINGSIITANPYTFNITANTTVTPTFTSSPPASKALINSITVTEIDTGTAYNWVKGQAFSPQILSTSRFSIRFTSDAVAALQITDNAGNVLASTPAGQTVTWSSTSAMGTTNKTFILNCTSAGGLDSFQLILMPKAPSGFTVTINSSPSGVNMVLTEMN